MADCPVCGEKGAPTAKFCPSCGTPIPLAAPSPTRIRKTVTIVFADVVGSTSMAEGLDPEAVHAVMSRYFETVRTTLERHGGTVEKFIGDAVMAVFGIPVLHEDDALRGVRAAAEMRDGLRRLNRELQRDWGISIDTRTGVNTGEVVIGDRSVGDAIVGDAVNTAARLEQSAEPGQILIGESTYRLVREHVEAEAIKPLALKGKAGVVPAYELRALSVETEPWDARDDSPFLARRLELAFLEVAFEEAVAERTCKQVTILGTAGVGKSRLVHEFAQRARAKASVVHGRCLPYGEGITYWPVAEVVREAAGIADEMSEAEALASIEGLLAATEAPERIASDLVNLLGLSTQPVTSDELQWAARKLFESLAVKRPLIVVFEDVHWAEPTFLDLIEHVTRWSRDAPILLLCLARGELLDERPGWGQERKRSAPLILEPLSVAACEDLIERLVPGLPPAVRARMAAAAGGIPLFVHSLISMLLDDGVLARTEEGWVTTGPLDAIAMPPTIQALLSARLDRLHATERRAIERASLVGEEFLRADIEELSSDHDRQTMRDVLDVLVHKDLIRPRSPDGEAYRFTHHLIRDAAYREMPKDQRAELHERFAQWVAQTSERARGYDEILAYHLEQAYRLRIELRPVDEHASHLASHAGALLLRAGKRAFARHDRHAAVNLLSRATELLPPDDAARLMLMGDLALALLDLGNTDGARAVAAEGIERAVATGDRGAEYRLRIRQDEILLNSDPNARQPEAEARALEAIEVFAELGDREGLSLAEWWVSALRFWSGHAADAVEGFARALGHAADDDSLAAIIITFQGAAQIWGPTPAVEIERWSGDILGRWSNVPLAEAGVLIVRAYARALRGASSDARQLANRARSIYADMGLLVVLARVASVLSLIEMLAGDAEAAERELRQSYELLQEIGDTGFVCTIASQLAEVVCEQGRSEEAAAIAERALELANPEDVDAQTRGKSVLALAHARSGRAAEADLLAREAVDGCKDTDLIMIRADAARHHAAVLTVLGKEAEAEEALRDARALYERKGNTVMVERIDGMLGEGRSIRESG